MAFGPQTRAFFVHTESFDWICEFAGKERSSSVTAMLNVSIRMLQGGTDVQGP